MKKHWINSAAGITSITMIAVSGVMLLCVFCDCAIKLGLTSEKANTINNILVSLSTNLIGIVVTISFVQYFIDKQDKEEERREEIQKILRYNKIIELLIDRYTLFFQCLTLPINKRAEYVGSKDLQRDFSFSDLSDLYKPSTFLSVELLRPTVELFYEAEHSLRDYMVDMIKDIDFKFFSEIEKVLIEFIENSKELDVSGVIINNQHILTGNKSGAEEASQYIKEEELYKWVDRFKKGELRSNFMTPYVVLYLLLKTEGQLLTKYQELVGVLNS